MMIRTASSTYYAHVECEFTEATVLYEIPFDTFGSGRELECYINDVRIVEFDGDEYFGWEDMPEELDDIYGQAFSELYGSNIEFMTRVGSALQAVAERASEYDFDVPRIKRRRTAGRRERHHGQAEKATERTGEACGRS